MAKSAAEVGTLFLNISRGIDREQREMTRDVANFVAQIENEHLSRAGLPPGSSFRGRPGLFRGATVRSYASKSGNFLVVGPSPIGPAVLWDAGSAPHTIVSKKVGGSPASRAQFPTGPGMFGGDDGYGNYSFANKVGKRKYRSVKGQGAVRTPKGMRAFVRHPGQSGKHYGAAMNREVMRRTPNYLMDRSKHVVARSFRKF